MLRLSLAALSGTALGWDHFFSFNDKCGADISFLRGTQFEASGSAGRIPYQFKHALEEVVKARIADEGCSLSTSDQALFYGFDVLNVLRFVDSANTELKNADFPCESNNNLGWNWKKSKEDFSGIVLPSTCTSSGFASSKSCTMKYRVLPDLFVEFSLADKCTDQNQVGYGLPQIALSCSGAKCAHFAKPCANDAQCGAGLTCDAISGSALADTLQFFLNTGLFNNNTDPASCSTGGLFQEKFLSQVINTVAQMLGFTTTVSTQVYSQVSLCGINSFEEKFIPTDAPTPVPTFRCYDGQTLTANQVCDGTNNCNGGEDEQRCRCGNQTGQIDDGNTIYQCCPFCIDYSNNNYPYTCSNQFCGQQNQGGGVSLTFCDFENEQGITCDDLLASNGVTLPAGATMSYVTTSKENEHIIGFSECNGNVQIGNPSDLGVLNFRVPIQNALKNLETIIKDQSACRGSVADWKRYFFPWSVNFWGGVFFSDQAAANILGNVNPGVKLDEDIRFYHDAQNRNCTSDCDSNGYCYGYCNYTMQPPFANIYNAPTTCALSSTTLSGSCEVALNITNWFAGSSFPAGWTSAPTFLRAKISSPCTGSAVPQIYVTCDGPCTSTSKSGCCLLKEPFVPLTGATCPTGYKMQTLESHITDFLFRNTSTHSQDSTLINFLNLVGQRTFRFSYGTNSGAGTTPFVFPDIGVRRFCLLDASAFGDNIDFWADTAGTDECPTPPVPTGNGTRGCPQVLSGGPVQSCTGAQCLSAPVVTTCGASGCPGVPVTLPDSTTNSAMMLAPPMVAFAGLALLL